jgi:hypothetical protein
VIDDDKDVEDEVQVDVPETEAPETAPDLDSEIRKAVDKQRDRDEHGKFKASEKQDTEETPEISEKRAAKAPTTRAVGVEPEAKLDTSEAKVEPGSVGPPANFSVAAKQAWEKTPEAVRADIVKRESEIEAGFKRYSGISDFAEQAERGGTTLKAALTDYAAVETALRQDFVGGVEFLCRRLGVQPEALLRGLSQRYQGQQGAQTNGQAQPIDQNALANHVAQTVRSEIEQRELQSEVARFQADPANKFFANVQKDMFHLAQSGQATTIKQAYEAACWLNPEIRAILVEETASGRNRDAVRTAAKAQNAAKAVSGAPASATNSDARPRASDRSLDEEIRAAINAQQG